MDSEYQPCGLEIRKADGCGYDVFNQNLSLEATIDLD